MGKIWYNVGIVRVSAVGGGAAYGKTAIGGERMRRTHENAKAGGLLSVAAIGLKASSPRGGGGVNYSCPSSPVSLA